MNSLFGPNSFEKIYFPMRKDPNPIALLISNQKNDIGIHAVIELLELININEVDPSDIEIFKLNTGQPDVQFKKAILDKKVYISFSHKDEYEVVATGLTPNGIDIEKKRTFNSKLIKKLFLESEFRSRNDIYYYLNDINERNDKDLACTYLFSLKESVAKAVGKGLKIKFNEIYIDLTKNTKWIEITYLNQIFHGYLTRKDNHIISFVEKIN